MPFRNLYVARAWLQLRWPQLDARVIELAAASGLLLAVAGLVVPTWLLASEPQQRSVNRLLDACQQGVALGDFRFVGVVTGALLTIWAAFVVSRVVWKGGHDARIIAGTSRAFRQEARPLDTSVAGHRLRLWVLPGAATAFTAGLFQPRVYIGEALLRFPDAERDAVLLHEVEHARRRDPLRCWLIDLVLSSLLWPSVGPMGRQYRACREADADGASVRALGDDRPLLRALLKVEPSASTQGICPLTTERQFDLRRIRLAGEGLTRPQRAGVALGMGVILVLFGLTFVGLSGSHSYWFCPHGAMG
jgi:beta-lactamase regulating signal transducer with metallopeptidase domain